jgi:Protein kinase domain
MADDARSIDGPNVADPDHVNVLLAPDSSRPMAQIGRYRIRRRLGHGGMGDVFEADDPALDRVVAIKVIRSGLSDPHQARDRFHREAKAAAALHHDNVVPIFDFDANGRNPYLVMPLLAGEPLKDRLDRERILPIADVLRIGRETAAALSAAHAVGLVHRDIKPANVWLETIPSGWRVRVLDFGLARAIDGRDRVTEPGPSPGTLAYMSPEQFRGDGPLDGRTDLYSLGVMLYEASTGRLPEIGGDQSLPPHEIQPAVPPALSTHIMQLLQRRPQDRPQSAEEVVATLTAIERCDPDAETATHFHSTTLLPRMTKARRPRWLIPGAVVACVLLGAFATWALWPPARAGTSPAIGPSPEVTAEPLRITAINVRHFAAIEKGSVDRGILGRDSFTTAIGDQVTVQTKLNRPAFAYLIAFRGDGTSELCFPEDPNVAPTRTDAPQYPSVNRDDRYGLREGTGLWVFAVIASDKPLPSYQEWAANRGALPWRSEPAQPGMVWFDDGQWVEALTRNGVNRGDRAKGEKVPGQSAVVQVTNGLTAEGTVAAAVGFAVMQRK